MIALLVVGSLALAVCAVAIGNFIGWFRLCRLDGLPFNWRALVGYDPYHAWLKRQGINPFPQLGRRP